MPEVTDGSVNSQFMPAASTKPEEMVLPSIGENSETQVDNISSTDIEPIEIEETLMKPTIRSIAAHEMPDFETPCYMLDMSELDGKLTEASLKALDSMLSGGNTAIYIKVRESCFLVGHGDGNMLYQILDSFVARVYGPECTIYKNTGNGFNKLKITDISGVLLDL